MKGQKTFISRIGGDHLGKSNSHMITDSWVLLDLEEDRMGMKQGMLICTLRGPGTESPREMVACLLMGSELAVTGQDQDLGL